MEHKEPLVATYEINGVVSKEGVIRNVRYVAAGNGFFRVDKTPFGEIVTKAKNLPDIDDMKPSFKWDLPKIPIDNLRQIVAFFQSIQTEASVNIYWKPEEKKYILFVPTQRVTGASVSYELTKEDQEFVSKLVQVVQIHSHVDMDAFFSATDDNDHQMPLVYGVIGHVHTMPVMKFRARSLDEAIDVKVDDIFFQEAGVEFPKEWIDRVKEKSRHQPYFGGSEGDVSSGTELPWYKRWGNNSSVGFQHPADEWETERKEYDRGMTEVMP